MLGRHVVLSILKFCCLCAEHMVHRIQRLTDYVLSMRNSLVSANKRWVSGTIIHSYRYFILTVGVECFVVCTLREQHP